LRDRVEAALREIGASPDLLEQRGLPIFEEASDLSVAHVSESGREHCLIPPAASAWQRMREAAVGEGVVLVMISGFRSFAQQLELIRAHLTSGQSIDEILTILAPPGCSEHHTGRAADIGTPGCKPLSERFEQTDAFHWLGANADSFGFRMSYPRSNPFGYCYEPWHWCFTRYGRGV